MSSLPPRGGRPAPSTDSARRHPPPLPPEFALAWSYTRSRMLEDCPRSVFWTYFGSRGAGLPPGHPDAARAWALRHLTALPLAVGNAVHDAAREVVAAVRARRAPPPYEALHARARGVLNHLWRNSQDDLIDRFWRWPGAHPVLREIFYRGTLRTAEIETARSTLASCLRHLAHAPVLDDLRRCAPSEVVLPEIGPTHFRLPAPADTGPALPGPADTGPTSADAPGDTQTSASVRRGPAHGPTTAPANVGGRAPAPTAWVAPDALYIHTVGPELAPAVGLPAGTRVWCVVDWKSGRERPEEEHLQLSAYGLWMAAAGYPSADDVYLGRVVHLRTATEVWWRIGPDERAHATAVIAGDGERMRGQMADPERAVPRPREEWALARDRRSCTACNYLELCREELRPLRDRLAATASRPERPAQGEAASPDGVRSSDVPAACPAEDASARGSNTPP